MTPALLLGLSAAMCWGTASFVGGLQARRLPTLTVALWSQIAGASGVAVALIARGEPPALGSVAWGAAAGLVGGVAVLLFYQALAVGLMSIVVPVSSCGAVVPVVLALATGTIPSAWAIAGIAAILAGIVLVSLQPGPTPSESGRARLALALALGAALGFGTVMVFLSHGSAASGSSPLWAVGASRMGLIATLLALSAARPGSARWPGLQVAAVASIGVIDTAGTVIFGYASTHGNLGVVSVLASLYPVVTVLLGRIVLAERPSLTQNVGVVLAIAGVALLAIG